MVFATKTDISEIESRVGGGVLSHEFDPEDGELVVLVELFDGFSDVVRMPGLGGLFTLVNSEDKKRKVKLSVVDDNDQLQFKDTLREDDTIVHIEPDRTVVAAASGFAICEFVHLEVPEQDLPSVLSAHEIVRTADLKALAKPAATLVPPSA